MSKIYSQPHQDKSKTQVQMTLIGVDSHAFSIIGAFRKEARRQNFNRSWIEQVEKEALNGDYNHLLATISNHVTMDNAPKVVEPQMEVTEPCPEDYVPSYWNDEGNYQELQDELWDELVPDKGQCIDDNGNVIKHAEMLRMITRLYYDIYNNGLCNDKTDEIEFLMYNRHALEPYMKDTLIDLENFKKFCEYYLDQLEKENEHVGYVEVDCYECNGSGTVDDYNADDESECVCDECLGSGVYREDDDWIGVDWLEWFNAERMRMLDRVVDGVVLFAYSQNQEKVTQK